MLNEKYISRMRQILSSEDFKKYVSCFNDAPSKAFHINTKKISPEKLMKLFPSETEPVPFLENSHYFNQKGLGNHPFHHAGMFYIQEPAAMFPIASIEIKPDWKILDMCAAPGGKSSQAMQYLSQDGQLVSNEINPSRCKTLCSNFERLGFKNATITCGPTDKLAEEYNGYFDLVIVDAPCSGEGMFRKEPTAIQDWSEENVLSCAKRQAGILDNAAKCVKGGGYILYSTCTFSPEENEMTVDIFLKKHLNFKPVKLNENVLPHTYPAIETQDNRDFNTDCMRRFYPFVSKGEGQFAAVLQNTDEAFDGRTFGNPFRKPNKNEMHIISAFIEENLTNIDIDSIFIINDKVILCDPTKLYPSSAYMCGVTLGQIQKNYIKPHHQLFSAYGKNFIRQIDFSKDDEHLDYYLHGGSFYTDGEKGWNAVTVEGVSLGGCKIVDGYLKNHYPKGLHILK